MTKTLDELRAEVAAKVALAKEQAAEMTERIQLTAQLNRATNTALIEAGVRAQLNSEATEKLKVLELACEQTVASMPVMNTKTRENRKWNPRREYGLGNQIQILSGILSGIQYSSAQHKPFLLAQLPGISEDLIESTLEAFGVPSYYSNNYEMVIPEVAADVSKLYQNLGLIEQKLDITIDKSKITAQVFETRFEVARLKAEKDRADAEAALALQKQKVVIN